MPSKKVDDDSKVMDVSKPGKGKIITTSRPVVAPIVSGQVTEESVSATPAKEEAKPLAPSATHKVIQPLSTIEVTDESDDDQTVEVVKTPKVTQPEPDTLETEVPEAEPKAEAPEEEPTEEQKTEAEKPVSAVKEEVLPSSNKPAPKTIEPKKEEKPAEEKTEPAEEPKTDSAPATSDAASVDAVASAAESKKISAKEAEEQMKRDAAVEELVTSKKYFVPIGTHHESPQAKTSGKSSSSWLVVLLIIIITLAAAGYLLNDAEVVDLGFDPPYELIK